MFKNGRTLIEDKKCSGRLMTALMSDIVSWVNGIVLLKWNLINTINLSNILPISELLFLLTKITDNWPHLILGKIMQDVSQCYKL